MKKLAEFGDAQLARNVDDEGYVTYVASVHQIYPYVPHGSFRHFEEEGPSGKYATNKLLDKLKEELYKHCLNVELYK